MRLGDGHDLPGDLFQLRGRRVGDRNDASAARLDFLQVRKCLWVHRVPGQQHNDRQLLVNEGNGAMLHLACGISLGVDVGDLLELQGPFERDRIIHTAAEIEEILSVTVFARDLVDLPRALHRLGHQLRQVHQIMDQRPALFFVESTEMSSDMQRQQIECRQLRGKGLGARHRDLGTSMGIEHGVRFACNRGIDGIADGEDVRALLLCFFDSRQSVGGFSGL